MIKRDEIFHFIIFLIRIIIKLLIFYFSYPSYNLYIFCPILKNEKLFIFVEVQFFKLHDISCSNWNHMFFLFYIYIRFFWTIRLKLQNF